MEGFKDESIYSKTIDYVFPDGNITLEAIQKFFSESGLSADPNILDAMKDNYGSLSKEAFKEKDLKVQYDSEKIKEFISTNYEDEKQNTNTESIYSTISKLDSDVKKEDIDSFIKDKNLENINDFTNYIINIIPK
jgi:hypothetical protein